METVIFNENRTKNRARRSTIQYIGLLIWRYRNEVADAAAAVTANAADDDDEMLRFNVRSKKTDRSLL